MSEKFVADEVTGPYKLVNGPLTPDYHNDATLFEDEDGQTYLYCSGIFAIDGPTWKKQDVRLPPAKPQLKR